jgi:hypothetical protein
VKPAAVWKQQQQQQQQMVRRQMLLRLLLLMPTLPLSLLALLINHLQTAVKQAQHQQL